MAIYPSPSLILVPALVLNLGLAVAGLWGPRPTGEKRPGLLLAGLSALVVLACAAFALFPGWDRLWPVLVGVVAGVGAGVLLEGVLPSAADDARADQAGALGAGLAGLSLLGLVAPDAVAFANGALGLAWGWGAVQLIRLVSWPPDAPGAPASGLALAATAVVGAAAAWGDKLAPGAGLGVPLAIALGTAAGWSLFAGRWVAVQLQRPRTGAAVAAVLYGVIALLLLGGPYAQPWPLWIATAAGAALASAAAAASPRAGGVPPVLSLALLVVAGALLVLDNRLMGILGIGLGGVGLVLGGRAGAPMRSLMVLVVTIFAARTWLQLFLDRTMLTGYGVDLTHPYAFAALIVGGLLPWAAVTVGRLIRTEPPLAVAWALVVALSPVWIGYFIHVEALGSLLAGLVLAAFLLGAARPESPEAEGGPFAATLLMTVVPSTLLAAPWLVQVMNATRQERLVMLLIGLAVILAGLGYWWARQARRPQEV